MSPDMVSGLSLLWVRPAIKICSRDWNPCLLSLKAVNGKTADSYLSTFRNFHGGDSARIDVFDPFFL